MQSFLPGIQIGENAVDFFAHFATQISDYVTVIRRTFLVGSIVAVKRPQNLCGSIDKFVAEEGAGTRQVVEVIHNAVYSVAEIFAVDIDFEFAAVSGSARRRLFLIPYFNQISRQQRLKVF